MERHLSARCSEASGKITSPTTDAAPTFSYWLYSRTYSSGTWGSVGTRDSLIGSTNYYMADPAVIYADDATTPDILQAWLHYTGATTSGIYCAVNNAGAITGPTLLYSKNAPTGDALESYYLSNVGVAQALYNEEEDSDLWLAQVGSNAPTAVDLLWFEANGGKKLVTLGWETASELDNLGFNLYRATEVDGIRTKVNAELIPVLVPPGTPSGAVYEYIDTGLKNKTTYLYWLEDVDIYGHTELHGPVSATTIQGKPEP